MYVYTDMQKPFSNTDEKELKNHEKQKQPTKISTITRLSAFTEAKKVK